MADSMKRKYHSPLREEQAAKTRERILAAGTELVHSFPSWDWKNLTAKAVSERAGVSERTVHRHFQSERELRDAVLQALVAESGVDLEHLNLGGFADVVVAMFKYLTSFAVAPDITLDPSQTEVDAIRTQALVEAVAEVTPQWPEHERVLVAAVLDMLWQPATQDRLKLAWGFDNDDFTRAVGWFTTLIQEALARDRRP
ncbi:MAG: TetR/AcrR family transcriptional regulator [Halioglobus sp.]|nr:TetR/AcrR family transcriptional regulator [Halioglobus sp.]